MTVDRDVDTGPRRPWIATSPDRGTHGMLGVAVGGALGSALRVAVLVPGAFLVGLGPFGPSDPTGEAVRLVFVNVLGAVALGALVGRRRDWPWVARWWPTMATGFLGGLTTFSSMVVTAGSLGHALGLDDPMTGRMTSAGGVLAAGYLAGSVALGIGGYLVGRRTSGRPEAGPRTAGRAAR